MQPSSPSDAADRLSRDPAPLPQRARFRAGDLLADKYRLERRVGEGSMGEVWLASNVALDMPVAVKLLHRGLGTEEESSFADLLVHEAQATAKLVHPAVVRVLDFGHHAGDPFIVLERLVGEDLRDRLTRNGPLSQEEAAQLVLPLVDAMHHAHMQGIVHRDLKPENVFMVTDELGRLRPKIVDFGIAALDWLDVDEPIGAGTPAYMAPEQWSSKAASYRVDIYAMGVMLLELITGNRPTDAAPELPNQVFDAATALSLADPQRLDDGLGAIIAKAIAARPEHRWKSMRTFGEALAQWLVDRGVEEDIVETSLRSFWLYTPSTPAAERETWLDVEIEIVTEPPPEIEVSEATPAEPEPAAEEPASTSETPSDVPPDADVMCVDAQPEEPFHIPRRRAWPRVLGMAAAVGAVALGASVSLDEARAAAVRNFVVSTSADISRHWHDRATPAPAAPAPGDGPSLLASAQPAALVQPPAATAPAVASSATAAPTADVSAKPPAPRTTWTPPRSWRPNVAPPPVQPPLVVHVERADTEAEAPAPSVEATAEPEATAAPAATEGDSVLYEPAAP